MEQAAFFFHTSFQTHGRIHRAFKEKCPGVRQVHIADDSVLPELKRNGGQPTKALEERLVQYTAYAAAQGASIGVCMCTTAGAVLQQLSQRVHVPMLQLNMPMLKRALTTGDRIAALVTSPTAAVATETLSAQVIGETGSHATIRAILVPEAFAAMQTEGDKQKHDRLIAAYADAVAPAYDVIVMAQASMQDAAALVTANTPVMTSIEPCVDHLAHYFL